MNAPGPVMLDLAGTELEPADEARLLHPHTGGVILFARNIVDAAQVAALCARVRALRPELLIAVDQEGGRVQRLRAGFTALPPLAAVGALHAGDPAAARAAARAVGEIIGTEVAAVGIDLSFAPVLDLDWGRSAVIGDRALHADPAVVAELGAALCAGLAAAGVAAVGKHFPGHGWAREDSHLAMAVDERSLDALRAADLQPFARLAGQLAGVMPAHVIYPAVDRLPAGFSARWLGPILRGELGFGGAVFSDDLAMEGAAGVGTVVRRAELALAAGCDMVLVCNRPDLADELLAAPLAHGAASVARLRALAARAPFAPRGSGHAAACARLAGLGLLGSGGG